MSSLFYICVFFQAMYLDIVSVPILYALNCVRFFPISLPHRQIISHAIFVFYSFHLLIGYISLSLVRYFD